MELPTGVIRLKKSREKPVDNHHPWIFSGAIAKGAQVEPGDIVDVVSSDDRWLARAYYNSQSQIRARILSWDPSVNIDAEFWRSRLRRAFDGRARLELEPNTTAYRLVNAEADGIPGLIVDKYGDHLVMQCLTMGIERRKSIIVQLLIELLEPSSIVERSDSVVRHKEGLKKLIVTAWGEKVLNTVTVQENGLKFIVDNLKGHKTGFYLDQRENRASVCQPRFVSDRQVLNVFSYTGAFAIYAATAGAQTITNIDESAPALELAIQNVELNGLLRPDDEYIAGNAFDVLRHFRDAGRKFDMVILDPPKFAHSRKDVDSACRGYKDLNWLAMRLLKQDGYLATFSCSGHISAELFQKVLFSAAVDAGRDVQIIKTLSQAADHPVLLTFPESAYLKGFLCRVL
jgi:23S rRNA (cytosine1962-C5)-methyltransferase